MSDSMIDPVMLDETQAALREKEIDELSDEELVARADYTDPVLAAIARQCRALCMRVESLEFEVAELKNPVAPDPPAADPEPPIEPPAEESTP